MIAKTCARCHDGSLEVVRESTVRRGSREYHLYWFRCRNCLDVSFRYRTLSDPDGRPMTDRSDSEEFVRPAEVGPLDPALPR